MSDRANLKEAKRVAYELMKEHYSQISGIPEINITSFSKGDTHVETARKCSILTAKQLMQEHSCYTLLDGRWALWAQVEIELNSL